MLGERVKWGNSKRIVRHGFLLMLLLWGTVEMGYGQDQVRKYATRQRVFTGLLGGTAQNPTHVIDQNPRTSSTLQIGLGALYLMYTEQVVDFNPDPAATNATNSPTFPAGTPITLKLSFPRELLGLLTGVVIQPITNLSNSSYTNVGSPITNANLLALLSGAGESEITITPNVAYQGVRVRLTSALGLGISIDFFHAYVMEDSPQPLDCEARDNPIDVLSGTRSAGLSLLTSLGGVTNPYNAINDTLTDYATMVVGVGALNTIYLNTIFETASVPGQKVRVILEDPGGLLNLTLLSSFTIQPYLRDQLAGPPLAASSPLLNLRLLPGTNKFELAYNIDEEFDRVELRFDNTVAALTSLRVYEVSRLPRIMLIEDPSMLSDSLTNCGQVDLSAAIANYQPDHYDYRYYTVANGGTALDSSVVTSSGTYYIEAIDPVTGCASERVPVTATVIALPEITLSAIPAICEGEVTAVIAYSNIQNGANEYSIEWDNSAVDFTDVSYTVLPSGPISISVPASATIGEYTGIFKIRNTETGCESDGYPITVTVLPLPGKPHLTISDVIN